MATAGSARRGRAMALWSTYSPMGVSLGLLLAGAFAGTGQWRGGYWIHLAMFAVLAHREPAAAACTARAAG